MATQTLSAVKATFKERLDMLAHLLSAAQEHLGADAAEVFDRRLAPDMHPLGAQIAFTCNQPRNFAMWCLGESASDLDPDVTSFTRAGAYIRETKTLLDRIVENESWQVAPKRVEIGEQLYLDLSGSEYLDDMLVPNFYFHLVIAYGLLRAAGVPLGKRDFMVHLVPRVRER